MSEQCCLARIWECLVKGNVWQTRKLLLVFLIHLSDQFVAISVVAVYHTLMIYPSFFVQPCI